jgi:glutamate-1-semialdehyde 2,1-aminomutase
MTERQLPLSRAAFDRAQKSIPGGVNSPVRAFKAVGGTPPFIARGKGSHITDIDRNDYIDYVASWGPLILGHAHPKVVEAIEAAVREGSSFGAPTERETQLAEMVRDALPSMELVRMVNSGTEAAMSAVRVARAFTKRSRIVKFDGCYHGHVDALLVKAGSGATTFGHPSSPGVPESTAQDTVSLRYNDAEMVRGYFKLHGDEVAAVIVEPVAANMGVVPPVDGFHEALREVTREHGALLIFDEVISGFRLIYGGAQTMLKIAPDLTLLGKIIGGGLPVGCYGGRRDVMEMIAPLGPVYQAGTLSGNPIAMAAGIATIEELKKPNVYRDLETTASFLAEGLQECAQSRNVPGTLNLAASMMTSFFGVRDVSNYDDALLADTAVYAKFHAGMLARGVYLPPAQFEAMFVSTAHTEEDIRRTLSAADEVFAELGGK